ncbi:MAG TPA: sulfite oxidase [Planctomycetaceae bacterium]|nr:sulfite oxidase [Planctomycetaceae bacterium]
MSVARNLAHAAQGLEGSRAAAPGMIIREKEPENLESDFASLDSFLTPNDTFYVRSHFSVPQVDVNSWRLKVEGHVSTRLDLSFEQLLQMPSETKPVTMECAGNGRVFLVPKVDGAQWQLGAVGTAEWTGVPLSALLERAKILPGTVDVILEGADAGEVSKPSRPAKPFNYARSIPFDQARAGGVLLAYKMNGNAIPAAHGYPVRAIVPGWFGMASVKWLSRIVLAVKPFQGYFQTVDYAYWVHRDGMPARVPVGELQVKAQIARPAVAEVLRAGAPYRIFGAAWSGGSDILKVEVSTNGGRTYALAKLLGKRVANAWRLWEFPWTSPPAGRHVLMAKATDAKGRTQPLTRDKDREGYMINQLLPIQVSAR